MPQNTPMKRQFTTIDGRTVMSNLPQHWGGNDWKITGVDNPLPVGNYVQTRAGVWIPQKGSDDGAADVRLTGSIVEQGYFTSIEVAPGERYRTPRFKSKLNKIRLSLRPGGPNEPISDFEIVVRYLSRDNNLVITDVVSLNDFTHPTTGWTYINAESKILSPQYEIDFFNTTSSDKQITRLVIMEVS